MPGIPTRRLNVPLNPGFWPQDGLHIPQQTGMPAVAAANIATKRDFFGMTLSFVAMGHGLFTTTEQVPAYGDFWCRSMSAFSPTANGSDDPAIAQPFAEITLTDLKSGYNFFNPYVWFGFLSGVAPAETLGGNPGTDYNDPEFSGIPRSELPMSYCFTRNSVIQITARRVALAGEDPDPVDLYFLLDGWLEYEYASG